MLESADACLILTDTGVGRDDRFDAAAEHRGEDTHAAIGADNDNVAWSGWMRREIARRIDASSSTRKTVNPF